MNDYLYPRNVSPLDPDLLITDDRSIFQSRGFVMALFKRADESNKRRQKEEKEAELNKGAGIWVQKFAR